MSGVDIVSNRGFRLQLVGAGVPWEISLGDVAAQLGADREELGRAAGLLVGK